MSQENKIPSWLVKTIIVFVLILTFLVWKRHSTLHSWWDLGLMIDILNTSLHGSLFYSNEFQMFTTTHLNILMAFIFPIHYLFQSTYTVLLFYVMVISLTLIPIYQLSKHFFNNEFYSKICVIGFILIPVVWKTALEDFQPIALGLPFLAYVLLKIVKKEFDWKYYLGLFLFLMSQEHASIVVIFIGIYLILKKRFNVSSKTIIIGLVWFILSISIILPHLSSSSPTQQGYVFFDMRYGYLGSTISEVVKTTITKPIFTLTHTPIENKINYLLLWFGMFLFLPLASSITIISVPIILMNILSTDTINMCISSHNSLLLAVILFVAGLEVLKKVRTKIDETKFKTLLIIFFIAILSISFVKEIKPMFELHGEDSWPCYRDDFRLIVTNNPQTSQKIYQDVIEEIKKIPKDKSVTATQHTFSHFAGFEKVITGRFAQGCYNTDYVLLDFSDGENNFKKINEEYQIITLMDEKYDLIFSKSNFYIFMKKTEGEVCV